MLAKESVFPSLNSTKLSILWSFCVLFSLPCVWLTSWRSFQMPDTSAEVLNVLIYLCIWNTNSVFWFDVHLVSFSPASTGLAIGIPLAIFFVALLIIIAFFIYRKWVHYIFYGYTILLSCAPQVCLCFDYLIHECQVSPCWEFQWPIQFSFFPSGMDWVIFTSSKYILCSKSGAFRLVWYAEFLHCVRVLRYWSSCLVCLLYVIYCRRRMTVEINPRRMVEEDESSQVNNDMPDPLVSADIWILSRCLIVSL